VSASMPGRLRRSAFWRGLLLQSFWDFENLQGLGLAFVMDGVLRRGLSRGESARAAALFYAEPFSTNAYLSGVAAGVFGRLEKEQAGREEIRRLKRVLGPGLAGIGDAFFWGALRPACAAAAAATFVAARAIGAPHPAAWSAAVYLAVFNAAALRARWAGLRLGWEAGDGVAARLKQQAWPARTELVRKAGLACAAAALLGELAAQEPGKAAARLALSAACFALLQRGASARGLCGAAAIAGAIATGVSR